MNQFPCRRAGTNDGGAVVGAYASPKLCSDRSMRVVTRPGIISWTRWRRGDARSRVATSRAGAERAQRRADEDAEDAETHEDTSVMRFREGPNSAASMMHQARTERPPPAHNPGTVYENRTVWRPAGTTTPLTPMSTV